MRINLTKKDIVNAIYMQIGFSKKISENLFDDIFNCIVENLTKHKKLKISKLYSIRVSAKFEKTLESSVNTTPIQ